MPDPYILMLFVVGALVALVAWLPLVFRRAPLSLPIVCVGLGAALFSLPQVGFDPLPQTYPEITERLTEFVVIIALMGAGLKIDRIFNPRRWGVTWRLLGVTMMLSIVAIVLLGWTVLGLGLAGAILLAGTLSPTDPVLASDIQVAAPGEGREDEVRFGLTSEAGLNDGLAFPFVNLAIALALVAAGQKDDWFVEWLTVSVLWEIGAGLGIGWAIGWLFGWLTFTIPVSTRLAATRDGFIALAATFISYSVTEMLHCYGFLAVFITALAFRHADRDHDFQVEMHDFIEQIERMAMMVVLVLFGGALASGPAGAAAAAGCDGGVGDRAGGAASDRDDRLHRLEAADAREADSGLLRDPGRGVLLLSGLWAERRAVRERRPAVGHRGADLPDVDPAARDHGHAGDAMV